MSKLLHSFYTKTKIQTGDVFLVWRIKKLIEQDKIVMQGEWSKGWKDITLALAGYIPTGAKCNRSIELTLYTKTLICK